MCCSFVQGTASASLSQTEKKILDQLLKELVFFVSSSLDLLQRFKIQTLLRCFAATAGLLRLVSLLAPNVLQTELSSRQVLLTQLVQ